MENEAARRIASKLGERDILRSTELDIPPPELHGVLLSLQSKGRIEFTVEEETSRALTEEGVDAARNGSPECILLGLIPRSGADSSVLAEHPIGSRYAFKNRWIRLEGERVVRLVDEVEDGVAKSLRALDGADDKAFMELKRRNLVRLVKSKVYLIRRGPSFGSEDGAIPELTASMIGGFNDSMRFKEYNFDARGNMPQCGALHPLMKMKEEFKRIFLEMGFSEMKTNRYVESSFWNFDALFQPQNHPSRDAHDTFFLATPSTAAVSDGEAYDPEYVERVRSVHTSGGYGSVGHSGEWSMEEASKNILRTHTTAVSSRYLKAMARDFAPAKLFSIDKVFRNESVDATHLAEFHQVEGLIAGYDLGIGELIGVLAAFFERLGLKNIKFKPAFNPYTEPSMEVFGYHEGLGKWIEIGNSGVFRPEMLRPMGYPEDVCVIAWGLSLERPAMIKYGLKNIRDLVGHKVDLKFVRNS